MKPVDEQAAGPRNLEVERSALGAALLYPEAADYVADNLQADCFFRVAHQIVFRAIKALRDRNVSVDPVTVKEQLGVEQLDEAGGPSYLAQICAGVPRRSNLGHYADILRELRTRRALLAFAGGLQTTILETDVSSTVLLEDADRTVLGLQAGQTHGRMASLRETSDKLLEDLEYRVKHIGELTGIETGFPSINEQTLGWQRGDLIVLAARPSIGKTTFVINTVNAASRAGAKAAVFSLEMRRIQLEYKMLASLSGVPLSRLLGGHLASHDPAYVKINQALEVMHSSPIQIDDTAARTFWDIRAACRRLKSEGGLDLVVIDYVQLMAGTLDRRGATRNEEITDISRRLKVLADEMKVAIILLSQLNRGAEGRSDPRPKLSDLRESGALEQDADLVCFIHRKNHRESGPNEFIIEKQRNGPTGTVIVTLDRDIGLFTDGGVMPVPTTTEKVEERKAKQVSIFKNRH